MDRQALLESYHQTQSMKKTARAFQISEKTVKKHLITAGVYTTALVERIRGLYSTGMPVKDIASLLKISENCVSENMPYTKGTYLTPIASKSKNAIRIQDCRARKSQK